MDSYDCIFSMPGLTVQCPLKTNCNWNDIGAPRICDVLSIGSSGGVFSETVTCNLTSGGVGSNFRVNVQVGPRHLLSDETFSFAFPVTLAMPMGLFVVAVMLAPTQW